MRVDPWTRLSVSAVLGEQSFGIGVEPQDSAYFSDPGDTLDPRLFKNGGRPSLGGAPPILKPQVCNDIMGPLLAFLEDENYHEPMEWAHPYLAGSGVSYYWSGHAAGGDLDVLIDADFVVFRQVHNVRWSDEDISTMINERMKAHLWPQMSSWRGYEVTYYVNPKPLHSIRPYAAVSLVTGAWLVPPGMAPEPSPAHFEVAAGADESKAQEIVHRYTSARELFLAEHEASPRRVSYAAQMAHAVKEGSLFFHDVHGNRRLAFSDQGAGWQDWHNYRWQAGKKRGWVPALSAMYRLDAQAREAHSESHRTGDASLSSQQALMRALKAV